MALALQYEFWKCAPLVKSLSYYCMHYSLKSKMEGNNDAGSLRPAFGEHRTI
jgi:hypothetical protein